MGKDFFDYSATAERDIKPKVADVGLAIELLLIVGTGPRPLVLSNDKRAARAVDRYLRLRPTAGVHDLLTQCSYRGQAHVVTLQRVSRALA